MPSRVQRPNTTNMQYAYRAHASHEITERKYNELSGIIWPFYAVLIAIFVFRFSTLRFVSTENATPN